MSETATSGGQTLVKPATSSLWPLGGVETSSAARVELKAGALDSLREHGGDDFLAEVIDEFLVAPPKLLTALRSALEQDDADELRRTERAKNRELTPATRLIDGIESEYVRLQEPLAALGSGTPS